MTLNPDECPILETKSFLRQFRATGQRLKRLEQSVVLAGATLLLSQPVFPALALSDEVRGMCEQAEQLINSRRTKEAINLLHRAQSLDPSAGEVHGYLGMAYQNSGNPQQAIPEYQQALQLNPQMTFINVNLGTCLMNMNQFDQAVPYFQQYLQTNPNAPDAVQVRNYIERAEASKQTGNLRSLVEQGQALLNQKRYPQAQAAFQQAIGVDPNFAPAHFFLGYAYANAGQCQQAIGEFQSALQIDPNMKEAVLNIGSNYQSLGDIPNAIAWYERFLKESPGSNKAGEIRQRIQGLRQQMQSSGGGRQPSPAAYPANGTFPQPALSRSPAFGGPGNYAQQPNMVPNDYFASAASAGKYFRWMKMPIRVCIMPGNGVPGYQNSYYQDLMDSFSQWAVASGSRITFELSNDPGQSDITCEWTGDANKVMDHGRLLEGGITKLNGQPVSATDVSISSARMTILTNRGGMPLSDDDMKKVCLHEVGHALGINGHSNNNNDVMFFSESPTILPILSNRDVATIRRLYGGPQ
jgi:tetratricopeptide (TPR) repeat protein